MNARSHRIAGLLAAWILVEVGGGSVFADTLVYFDEDGYQLESLPRGLYNLDLDSGTTSLRTEVSNPARFFAIDYRPQDDTFYAVDLLGGVWTIDIDNGDTELVFDTGISPLISFAINPLTGEAYGLRIQSPGGFLYRIDIDAHSSLNLGFLDIDGGLAYRDDGQLFGFDSHLFFTIDPSIPFASRGPQKPGAVNFPIDATFTRDGRLFVSEFEGTIGESFVSEPLGGGQVIYHSAAAGAMLALTAIPPIPELSALVLTAMILAVISVVVTMRRFRVTRVSPPRH